MQTSRLVHRLRIGAARPGLTGSAAFPRAAAIPAALLALALLVLGCGAAAHPMAAGLRPEHGHAKGELGVSCGAAAHPAVAGLWHEHGHAKGEEAAAFAARHGFLGVWQAGAPAREELVLDLDRPGFEAQRRQALARGLRLVDLETFAAPGGRRWGGLFRAGSGDQRVLFDLTWRDLESRARQLAGQGLVPLDIETWSEGGVRRWAGVFAAGKGESQLRASETAKGFAALRSRLAKAGLGLVDFEVYSEQGTPRFAGVFRAGEPAGRFEVGDAEAFHRLYHKLKRALRLADVETFREGGKERYAGLWRPGTGGDHLWVNGCEDPCRGAEELARQADHFEDKRAQLAGCRLVLVDFEPDLQEGAPAGPSSLAAAAAPPAPSAPAVRAAPRSQGQAAPAGGLTDVQNPVDPTPSHRRLLHDAGSTGPP